MIELIELFKINDYSIPYIYLFIYNFCLIGYIKAQFY